MSEITRELAKFAIETRWEDLPDNVVREIKLIFMETIGCALGALSTDKGKMMAALGRRFGGPPEASIIGIGDKVSCSSAALANGELAITLDYHNIIAFGHDGVYVLPAILAIGENNRVSGKELILSIATGLEISARLARAVGRHNITPEAIRRQRQGRPGLTGNAYSNFGAAAGAARLMCFDTERTLHAMGIAGHLCMVLSYGRWGAAKDRYMAKYGVPGWQSTGAVTAVMLAEMGYKGDTTVLDDPERGFRFYTGYPNWYPEEILEDLGKDWCFTYRLHYKPYPCCGVFHSILDCVNDIIEQNDLKPNEIESVKTYSRGPMRSPLFSGKEMDSISGAQFNSRYNISVLVHRVPRGPEWVDPDTMKNPEILAFMDRISMHAHPDYDRVLEENPASSLAKVEIVARGETFTVERRDRIGTVGSKFRWTEEDAEKKFRHNALRILTKNKINKAVELFFNLEKVDNISELMREVTL